MGNNPRQPERIQTQQRERAPERKRQERGGRVDKPDGIKPKDADPDYGPPDPDDPQRSGT